MRMQTEPALGRHMTFELSKKEPVHGWFWYKEGFSPEIFEYALGRGIAGLVVDPFCGVGTTLLAAKQKGIDSIGVDASPLAVFVSKAKTDDYSQEDLDGVRAFLTRQLKPKEIPERLDMRPLKWEFELFDPKAAFPRRNYNQIMALRDAIEQEEGRVRNLLLLGLLSVLPQASLVLKDGGVLKIRKDKRALPAKEIFKRKVKRMLKDLEGQRTGHVPRVFLGDARALDMPTESTDLIVTSPPYLNNIDYSKVYGLELSLLHMSRAEAEEVRMRAIRSFIGKDMEVGAMPPEAEEVGSRIPIAGTYFQDMEKAIEEMHRILKTGKEAHVIVSNSVIHSTHIMVDEIFGEMATRLGFSDVRIIVGAERIADVKPQKIKTRESIVVMRK